jgi:hypothetical protein
MLKIFICFVVASVAVIAALILTGASLSQYIAVLISSLALTVSMVSAFKEDIFSFQPMVLFDEIIMAPPSGTSHDSVALVLPLTFINKGHGAGVVNMLALRVESVDGMKLYTPLQQVDFEKYISGRRKLHAENIKGSFNAFALGSRATTKMYLHFSQEEHSEKYPFSSWTPGTYKFRLFFNQANGDLGREVACLGPMQITGELLSEYKVGTGVSLCPSRQISV